MKAYFVYPPKLRGEKDDFSTLEAFLAQHLKAEVVRLPRVYSGDDAIKWLQDARDNIKSATVLLLIRPSQTLSMLGEYGAEFVEDIITRMEVGVPAIVSISSADLPNNKMHNRITIKNLEKRVMTESGV